MLLFRTGLLCLFIAALYLLIHAPGRRQMSVPGPAVPVRETLVQQDQEAYESPGPMMMPPASSEQPPALGQYELPSDPEAARAWAIENPQEALATIVRTASSASQSAAVEVVCEWMARSNPDGAVLLAQQLGGGCTNLLENLVGEWAVQDEAAARDYAMDQPAGEERDRLVSRVAFILSTKNPAEAAAMVVEGISPGTVQDDAAIVVLHQWALRDKSAASSWARLFPENLRGRALKEISNVAANGRE